MVNPKECRNYRIGGYCCVKDNCKHHTNQLKNEPSIHIAKCNEIFSCGDRSRCHVKIGSNGVCTLFKKK